MSASAAVFLDLVCARRGHFRLEAVARHEYDLWLPDQCPLCAAGMPLEDTWSPADNENIS